MGAEWFGIAATGLAITGCWMNNRRRRVCFLLWGISNLLSLWIHADAAIWSLAVRNAAFLLLAVEGWRKWK